MAAGWPSVTETGRERCTVRRKTSAAARTRPFDPGGNGPRNRAPIAAAGNSGRTSWTASHNSVPNCGGTPRDPAAPLRFAAVYLADAAAGATCHNGGMLIPAASLARKIVRDMHIYTRGRPMHWVPVHTVMRRLVLKEDAATEAAFSHAASNGWLELNEPRGACLTNAGRRLTKG